MKVGILGKVLRGWIEEMNTTEAVEENRQDQGHLGQCISLAMRLNLTIHVVEQPWAGQVRNCQMNDNPTANIDRFLTIMA